MTISSRYLKFLQIKPLICGALLGVFGALGFFCMVNVLFSTPKEHPYFHPFCVACGFVALVACILILFWCFHRFSAVRHKAWILLGMLAVTAIFFCLFVPGWGLVIALLREGVHPHLK